ncbi:MAG: lipase maturation factor family protein [Myxococcota bacterium]|nr:lipase maturation factor family protein [Myxococcota bacterium]MDW8361832.1 lipase maturation factor family protein [Myxococcales bacterium]
MVRAPMERFDEIGRRPPTTWWLGRFVFLRLLGLVYTVAFLVALEQAVPLIGERGILPATWWLERVAAGRSYAEGFAELPSLFWWTGASDEALRIAALIGLVLGIATTLGATHALVLAMLWWLQLSFVHVGQTFWAYGWETLLCEAGLLAVFVAPVRSVGPFPAGHAPPAIAPWLLRWLTFRLMFGAGLIKLRGDPCWIELSCLDFHYETQPNPHPLSPWFHALPPWVDRLGVLFNHAVELAAPPLLFAPGRWRIAAVASIVAFQAMLIASGNLSFLNWLSIAVALGCLDDRALAPLLPAAYRARLERLAREPPTPSRAARIAVWTYAGLVVVLSIDPVVNLLSRGQLMNASFDRLRMVNTYGAFGVVDRERLEVQLEGTLDDPLDPRARWLAYELPCKPGPPERMPCLVTPYHYRLDWQMWFAWHGEERSEPWLVRLADLLLRGEPAVRPLFRHDPFGARPPRAIRVTLWRYRMAGPFEPGIWWRRERLPYDWLPPVWRGQPSFESFLERWGWRREATPIEHVLP